MMFRGRCWVFPAAVVLAAGSHMVCCAAALENEAKSPTAAAPAPENAERELLLRLKREFAEAGDDLDRKQQLIQWALGHGRAAVEALHPVALREGKRRLAHYRPEFQRRIAAAPKKNAAAVLSVDPELKAHRNELVRFSEMARKLKEFLDREKTDGELAADAPDFETFLASLEQSAIGNWKAGMGYQGLDEEEIFVVEKTNQVRRERGLRPLMVDPRLCHAARDHSKDMVEHKFFSHESPVPGKRTFGDRARRAGTTGSAENIYSGSSGEGAMKSWMKSEGHRNNILREGHLRIGVGRCEKRYTQVFGS